MFYIFVDSKDLRPFLFLCSIPSLIEYWDEEICCQEFKYVIISSAEVMS